MKKTSGVSLIVIASLFSGCTNQKLIENALNECRNKPDSVVSSDLKHSSKDIVKGKIAPPSYETLLHANYGSPITTEVLEQSIRQGLKDPYSALVSCTSFSHSKSWYQEIDRDYIQFAGDRFNYEKMVFDYNNPHSDGSGYAPFSCYSVRPPHYGYVFKCTTNAKNGFGGYTGETETYYFQEGSPDKDRIYPLSWQLSDIQAAPN
jgi:hypothetical protein